MVNIIFKLKTKPNKYLEFMQSIGTIIVDLRNIKGCDAIDFQKDDQAKDRFYLRLDWKNRKDLTMLLESKEYNFLDGAISVLCEIPIIEIINDKTTMVTSLQVKSKTSIKHQILAELSGKL